MNEITLTIIVIILVLVFFMHYESKYSELTYVTSSIDKDQYLVRNREDKEEAADILATIKKNLVSQCFATIGKVIKKIDIFKFIQ